ncbi:heavy-metal-associated domain-containing protein [Psychroserpens sp. SPM9]|uniref:heavy-metal-associated domain-containing protein n=1 Tax=Psychroserpens sp. SPM9 TaxID=2975598 RepID=UPI0021A4A190|nr:MauE/DoxX family redox-associated membrane protein [Psychroserpens sp. SPM9]MDG5492773.1 cation transporter [Psychroserpens sp. SPM9]
MTHTYTITGMTCNGCKSSVEQALSKVDNIETVAVDLEQSEAKLTMSEHVSEAVLQQALPEKYTISEKKHTNVFASVSHTNEANKSELLQLFPLFLIFGYLIVASVLLHINPWNLEAFMLDFMGLFYIVFSFFKLLDLKGFPESFKMYDPLAKAIPAYGWIYPFIEVTLGLLFLMRIQIPLALIATLVVLGITTFGVTKTLLDKKSIQCACLGTALKLPMTKATFIENTVMIIMAVIMLIKTYN